MTYFHELPLSETLVSHLTRLGFETLTPIQQQAIPHILQGNDVIAKAKTGSGKTLAFLVPLVAKMLTQNRLPQALIITPTRELAEQIATELKKLAQYKPHFKVVTLYGGVSLTKQALSMEKGADVLIGTPGRLLDHLFRESIDLHAIETLILDEADRMLDMGFMEDILKIVAKLPSKRQSLLFSATYPRNILELSKSVLNNPVEMHTAEENLSNIEEILYPSTDKKRDLITVLQAWKPKQVLIFCNTKIETNDVADFLWDEGYDVATLSGELDQVERQEMLIQFSNTSLPVMVATDLAARGLDIEGIDLIINYDFPEKASTYTHRIGRTARADATGRAISLVSHSKHPVESIAPKAHHHTLDTLVTDETFILQSPLATLCIEGGKKDKLRAGDILGTLCKEIGIPPAAIGKITLLNTRSYIAIDKNAIRQAYQGLKNGRIKKKKFRVRQL